MSSSESQVVRNDSGFVDGESSALQKKATFYKDLAPILLPKNSSSRSAHGVRERLLSVTEVARTLSVCDATVYKLCARGLLGHVRILNAIRVPPASVDAFVASRPRFPGNLRG
jgi:excisionase family DNA binding protein